MITVHATSNDNIIRPEVAIGKKFTAPAVNKSIVAGCPCDTDCVWRSRCRAGCHKFNAWVVRGMNSKDKF